MNFRLLIDSEVIEFLESLPRTEQRQTRNCLVAIQNIPSHYSDYSETDCVGRPVNIHIHGKYAIKFWIDHADQHVKILDLHFADRGRS